MNAFKGLSIRPSKHAMNINYLYIYKKASNHNAVMTKMTVLYDTHWGQQIT